VTIQDLGSIGELVAAIATVATLVYLAVQIRQNTKSVRSAAFQSAQRDLGDKLDSLAQDPELLRVFFDGNRDFESFSREDRRRYATFMVGMFRRYETLLYHTRLGNIEQGQWEGPLSELHNIFRHPGARAWWVGAKGSFNRELRNFIDREVLDSETGTPAAQQAAEPVVE